MQTKRIPNATRVKKQSFQSILETMMKLTKGGNLNLRTANSHWDIFPSPANNNNYSNYKTGA